MGLINDSKVQEKELILFFNIIFKKTDFLAWITSIQVIPLIMYQK